MRKQSSNEYGRREFRRSGGDEGDVLLASVGVGVTAAAYLLARLLHLRPIQIEELGLYVFCSIAAVASLVWYGGCRRERVEKEWPHRAVFVPLRRTMRDRANAAGKQAVVAGYDLYARPWHWSDDLRCMQAIVLGQSGSGKSTLLHNIAAQDIHRTIEGRHLPLIVFDGKGDQEFLRGLLYEVCAAGRLDQLRVLDPLRPEISARFNPLFASEESAHEELVAALFESFVLRRDFFRAHQAAYLSDICRVLHLSNQVYNIFDVLVMVLAALFAMNHLPLWAAPLLLPLLAAGVLVQAGFGPAAVNYLADCSEALAADRSALMAFYTVTLAGGGALGAVFGGLMSRWLYLDGVILLGLVLSAVAWVTLGSLIRQERGRGAMAATPTPG